jgi:uncharacterized membrane protein
MALITSLSDEHNHPLAIRKLSLADLQDALLKGIEDFKAKPTFGIFIAVIYPLVTLGAFLVVFNYDWLPLVFPAVSGFLLIGPFFTIGMCEISRRREAGEDTSALSAFDFHRLPAFREIMLLGLLLVALFFMWLATAMTIYSLTLGDPWQSAPAALDSGFIERLFTTAAGWTLIIAGNAIGFMFAVAALCVGALSFPVLLDRSHGHMSIATAVQTSIRVVLANPVVMAAWGLIVVGSMIAGAIPLLVGLSVVIPVLGHATWHLYRKAVAPN